MSRLTPEQALELISKMAANGENDFVDFHDKESRHNKAATAFGDIYMVAHSTVGDCKHPDWEEQATELYEKYKDQ